MSPARLPREQHVQLIEAVAAHAPVVLWAADADGTCTLSTGQGLAALGHEPGALVGRNLFEVSAAEPEVLASYRRALAGEAFRSEAQRNGHHYSTWFEPLRDEHGTVTGLAAVSVDISDRVRAEELERVLVSEQRALFTHLFAAQEAERRQIAQDIHDDTIQVMSAVDVRLQLVRRGEGYDDALTEEIAELHAEVRQATLRLRQLMFDLDPPAVSSVGLADTLDELARRVLGATPTTWRVSVDDDDEPPPAVMRALGRLAREGLSNVVKHAQASAVEIDLRRSDGGWLLCVADDGVGASGDLDRGPRHRGLRGIQERIEASGGRVEIGPRAGGGTVLRAWLPELLAPLDGDRVGLLRPLQEVFDAVGEAFVALDETSRIVFVNAAAAAAIGRPAADLLGRTAAEVYSDDAMAALAAAQVSAVAEGRAVEFETVTDGRRNHHRLYPSSRGMYIFSAQAGDGIVAGGPLAGVAAVAAAVAAAPDRRAALSAALFGLVPLLGADAAVVLDATGSPIAAEPPAASGATPAGRRRDVPLQLSGRLVGNLRLVGAAAPPEETLALAATIVVAAVLAETPGV